MVLYRWIRRLMSVLLVVCLAVTLAGCEGASSLFSGGEEVNAVVDNNGFAVETSTVKVQAPIGVAPEGTQVRVRQLDSGRPDVPDAALAESVEVVLGEGLQPEEPITVTVKVDEPQSATVDYVVMRADESSGGYVGVDATVRSDSVTFTTDHLSIFDVFKFNPKEAWTEFEVLLGLQYPKPECVDVDAGHSPDLNGEYSMSRSGSGLGGVWICADRHEHLIGVDVYSNGPVAWEVSASHDRTRFTPSPSLDLGQIATTAAHMQFGKRNSELLVPGGDLSLLVEPGDTPVTYEADASALWSTVGVVLNGALTYAGKGERLDALSRVGDADAVMSCLDGTTDAAIRDQVEGGAHMPVVTATIGCIQTIAGEHGLGLDSPAFFVRLNIISRVIIAQQAVVSAMVNIGANEFSVTLEPTTTGKREDPTTEPVDADEGVWHDILTVHYTDDDGYTYEMSLNEATMLSTYDIANAKPGEALAHPSAEGQLSVTNTTPGRNAPGPGANLRTMGQGYVLVAVLYPENSLVCQHPGMRTRDTFPGYCQYGTSLDLNHVELGPGQTGTARWQIGTFATPRVAENEAVAFTEALNSPAGFALGVGTVTTGGTSWYFCESTVGACG